MLTQADTVRVVASLKRIGKALEAIEAQIEKIGGELDAIQAKIED